MKVFTFVFLLGFVSIATLNCSKSKSSGGSDDQATSANDTPPEQLKASGEGLEGVVVNFPPGSVAVSTGTHFFSEKAASLEEQGVLSDLPLPEVPQVVDSGAAFLIVPSREVQVLGPFTIALQVDSGAALQAGVGPSNVVVIYKTVSGIQFTSGVIPQSELTFENGKVTFATSEFGAFQVVTLSTIPDQRIQAESKLKFVQTVAYENLVDGDGIGKPIVSLRPVVREYPLEPSDLIRHYINGAIASAFPIGGRCSENGTNISVEGLVSAKAVCDNYAWSAGDFDVSATPDGETSITLKMEDDSLALDTATDVILKDVSAPVLTRSGSGSLKVINAQSEINFVISSDVAHVKWQQKSGPGSLVVSQHTFSATALGLRINGETKGDYILTTSVFDLAENATNVDTPVSVQVAAPVLAALPPAGFSISNQAGETSTGFSIIPGSGYDHNTQGFGGYLIVRRAGAAVSFSPTDGTEYQAGKFADPDHKIIINAGNEGGSLDTGLLFVQTYHYKVFFFNIKHQYSTGVAASVVIQPLTNSQVGAAGGYYYDVVVSNAKLYAAKGKRGLDIFDIAGGNAQAPVLLGSLDLDSSAKHLFVEGSYAYLSLEQGGLAIVDVSDAANPVLKKTVKPDEYASYYGVYVDGGYAYLGTFSTLYVIDVDPVLSASKVGEISGVYTASRMLAYGNTLYVTAGTSVHALNVTTKTAPTISGTYTNVNYSFKGLASDGTNLFVGLTASSSDGVAKMTIASLLVPGAVPDFYTPVNYSTGNGVDVVLSGSSVLFSMGTSGVYSGDLSPAQHAGGPVNLDTSGQASGMAMQGTTLYLADYDSGLVVIDAASATTALTQVKSMPGLANVEDVRVSGNYAYLADAGNGLSIYDVTNKSAPVYQGGYKVANAYSYSVDVIGSTAFVTMDDEGIVALDVSVPSSPTLNQSNTALDDVRHVAAAGSNIMVGTGNGLGGGFYLMDQSLNVLSSLTSFEVKQSVYDGTRYAYSVSGAGSVNDVLRVIDLSNPNAVSAVTNMNLGRKNAIALAYRSNYLYVIFSDFGLATEKHILRIYNVSNPLAPTVAATKELNAAGKAIKLSGDYAYIAKGGEGVGMVNIANPAQPFIYGTMKVSYDARGLSVSGDHVFVADGYDGFTIHDRVK